MSELENYGKYIETARDVIREVQDIAAGERVRCDYAKPATAAQEKLQQSAVQIIAEFMERRADECLNAIDELDNAVDAYIYITRLEAGDE